MSPRLRMSILTGIVTVATLLTASPAKAQGETIIASDNFNRPNETPFAVGGNWGRTVAGNFDGVSHLTNNQVTSVSNEGIYYWQGAGTFDPTRQYSRLKVVQKDGEVGLVLLAGPQQAIMVGWGPPGVGDTVYIYWYSNGTDRGQLTTGPSTLANGDIVEASLENGVIYAKVNGVTVKSVANTTTLTTGTPGFITYLNPSLPSQVSILDDWQAGTPASYTIGGTITENATGLSGAQVTASGGFSGTDTTDGTGAFAITGVPSGATSIVLTSTLPGHTMSPLSRTVAGPINTDVTGLDFTSTLNTSATLTVSATHGTVTKNPDQPTYAFGAEVTLTPVPDAGYNFASWSGDLPTGHATDNPLIVTMSQDRTITANFAAPNVVASDDFNRADETPLTVGGNWQRFSNGGLVNLTGNEVAGVSGDALYFWQGSGTFDSTRQFSRAKVTNAGGQIGLVLLGTSSQALVVSWSSGTLYIYWYSGGIYQGNLVTVPSVLLIGDVIEAVLDSGTVYAKINGSIVASAANTTSLASGRPGFETFLAGAKLDDWEAGTPQSFTMSGTITENAAGLSGVLVTASGGFSGSATTNGNGLYSIAGVPLNATSIVLTPTLAGHTMSPLTRTVDGPVAANVTGEDFTSTLNTNLALTIQATHGIVTKNPNQPTYAPGTIVTLTPVPDGAYIFTGWSGDVPSGHAADDPLTVTMDQDRTITANFLAPGVAAADYFDRANESPLLVGGNWQRYSNGGFVDLTGHEVAGVSGDALYYWLGSGTFDNSRQFSRVKVTNAGGQVGLVLLGTSSQALVASWSSGTLYIYWYSAGSYQGNLSTTSSTLQNGDSIEAVLDGGFVSAKVNGVVVASVANSTTLSSGRPGFEAFLAGAVFDEWESGIPIAVTCVSASDGTPCNDGNTCTRTDTCQAGVCIGANPIVCNDSNVCTDDSCDPASGACVYTNDDTNTCSDGNACTQIDTCQAGVCSGGNPVVCAASDQCHVAGVCNTATGVCSNPLATDGMSCSDGDACTQTDACQTGVCTGSNPVVCTASDQCHVAGVCNPGTGVCSNPNATDGTSCTDDNACTQTDACQAGVCTGANPVVCAASDQCHVAGVCNTATGVCSNPNSTDGTTCNDDNACTQTDACQAGVCTGANPVICAASDQCHDAGVCNPATGACSNPSKADGTSCNDGSACTQTDTCQAGVCTGGNPVVCAASDQCHVAGVCNTATGVCSNPNATDGTSCNDGNACTQTDACQAGVCTGANPVICAASDQCHVAGVCNTATGVCSNPNATNGTSCNDGNACTQTDACQAGVCTGANPVICAASDQCHVAGVCNTATGVCSNPNATNGTSCNDGNACTQTDACQAGVCTGSNPVVCAASDQCHVAGVCSPATGVCSNPLKANGTSCGDGNACTQTDTCQAGVCTGGNPVVCNPSDQCHVAGVCNPGTGVCSNPLKANGTSCNDGNACTQTDACQAGVCTGSNPVVCTASDQCHVAGVCSPATGVCSNPLKANGTSCNDGNACTQSDTCQVGVCTGSNPVVCAASDQCHSAGVCNTATGVCSNPTVANGTSCNDGNACTQTDACQAGVCTGSNPVVCTASDQCHVAGVCSPATGVCSNPLKANGTSCNDGNACTQSDTCQVGVCTGSNPVVCAASDQCHDAGVCNPATGACSNPSKADGTSCNDGNACTQSDTCQVGVCTGSNPVVCAASDQCHSAGVCNTATGVCSNPTVANGTSCGDGNACTQTDTCQAGVCTGGNPVVCNPSDQCHNAGVCNPGTGVCSNPPKADGTGCGDGNACTQTDICLSGVCTSTNPVTCPATDQCHDPGVCDTATGVCSNPPKANGASCDDGNACTQSDSCEAGVCTGANPVTCAASDQCHVAGLCDTVTGVCSDPTKADGAACSDGSACTTGDACQAGACISGTVTVCTASDQCHMAGVCDTTTGVCSNPTATDGASCNDGNACTTGDTCQAGACTSGTATVCAASDQCHVAGVCDTATGACSNPLKTNGTSCGDGNACTQTDTCQAGVCAGSNPVVCTASDQCHDAGVCNPATGVCSNPSKADGTSCGDGNACTQTDTCQAGQCTGGNPVPCLASDQCHLAGTCNTATGVCSQPQRLDGTACTDGNGCTAGDTCQGGTCAPGAPTVCAPSDQCHSAGVCDTATGACSNPQKADGTGCGDGNACTQTDTCQAGVCTGTNPVACTASDQCHAAGLCDTITGACSNPPTPDGTSCGDGNACTQTDTCQAGVCAGGNTVVCTALDTCHDAGICNPATGVCSDVTKADGAACSSGNACTLNETCSSGVCGGGSARNCNDSDGCTADACDPLSGCMSQTVNIESTSFSANRVDGRDLTVLADAWNSCPGDLRYNPAANLDQASALPAACIDLTDFHFFMNSFGQACTP